MRVDDLRAGLRRMFHIWLHPASGTVLDILNMNGGFKGHAPRHLQFAVKERDSFPGFGPPKFATTRETPGKLALRELADLGWVCADYVSFNGRESHLKFSPSKQDCIAEAARMVSRTTQLGAHTCVRFSTHEGIPYPESTLGDLSIGLVPEPDYTQVWERNGLLNELLDELAALPFSDHLTVLGSAGSGKPFPGDLDIVLDMSAMAAAGHEQPDVAHLLALGRYGSRFYGLLDPFLLMPDGRVLSRDAEGRRWVEAQGADIIRRASKAAPGLSAVGPFTIAKPPSLGLLPKQFY